MAAFDAGAFDPLAFDTDAAGGGSPALKRPIFRKASTAPVIEEPKERRQRRALPIKRLPIVTTSPLTTAAASYLKLAPGNVVDVQGRAQNAVDSARDQQDAQDIADVLKHLE